LAAAIAKFSAQHGKYEKLRIEPIEPIELSTELNGVEDQTKKLTD
jgi:hypothetical protein